MYFLRKIIFHFPSVEKISHFREKEMPYFLMIKERPYSSAIFLERPPFQNIWRIYHISMYFFWGRSSFIFRGKNKVKFSGKRNIIFPDYTRKIIFQYNFFRKTIFSEHLEKNMVFCAVVAPIKTFFSVYHVVLDINLWKLSTYSSAKQWS